MKWENIELKKVTEVIAGQSPPSAFYNSKTKGIPFFQGKADFGNFNPTVRYWTTKTTKISLPGDILFSVRAPVGSTNINNIKACIGRGLAAIRPSEKIELKYLLHFFRYFEPRIKNLGTGSTFKAITIKTLKDIQILLPPLPIQQQIADLLDTADALRRTTAEQLQQLDDLAESVFLEMFGDVVRNEKGWEKKQLRKIGKIQTGNTPPRSIEKYYGNDVEWIKTDNINIPQMYLSKAKEFLSLEGEKKGRTVDKGAILVTCIAGSKRVIGNPAISDRKVAFNQQINSISPYKASSLFLYYQFIIAQPYVQSFSTNGMKGMINKTAFGNIEFIIPPIELQNEFEKIIENIEVQKAELKQSLQDSEDLFKGLLQEIFN